MAPAKPSRLHRPTWKQQPQTQCQMNCNSPSQHLPTENPSSHSPTLALGSPKNCKRHSPDMTGLLAPPCKQVVFNNFTFWLKRISQWLAGNFRMASKPGWNQQEKVLMIDGVPGMSWSILNSGTIWAHGISQQSTSPKRPPQHADLNGHQVTMLPTLFANSATLHVVSAVTV